MRISYLYKDIDETRIFEVYELNLTIFESRKYQERSMQNYFTCDKASLPLLTIWEFLADVSDIDSNPKILCQSYPPIFINLINCKCEKAISNMEK